VTDSDIRQEIERLVLTETSTAPWSAPGIARRIVEDHPKWKGRMPTERTIQNIVRKTRPKVRPQGPVTGWWSFMDEEDPEAAARVAIVLAELTKETLITRVSIEEATRISRLRLAFADLPAMTTLALARAYVLASEGHPMFRPAGLDRYLGFTPWRDGAKRYLDAFANQEINEYLDMPGDPPSSEASKLRAQRRQNRGGHR
jgi:hypothetical protein